MQAQSSATPQSELDLDRLARIEAKLDELLELKDAALAAFPKAGRLLALAKLRKLTK